MRFVSFESMVERMEENLRWTKRNELMEKRQNGFLDGLESAGRGATSFLGGLFNPGAQTTPPVEQPPAETPTPAPQPPTEEAPTTQVPPILTETKPSPTPSPSAQTTERPVTTTETRETTPRETTPAPTTERPTPRPTTSEIESIISSTLASTFTPPESILESSTVSTTSERSATPSLSPTTIEDPTTLLTSTRPQVTENPVSANPIGETSQPSGGSGSNTVTTIVVSIVVIIFGSIAILSAAYWFSKRYIRKRKLAQQLEGEAPPSPPMKAMDSRFAPGYEVGGGVPVSKNF